MSNTAAATLQKESLPSMGSAEGRFRGEFGSGVRENHAAILGAINSTLELTAKKAGKRVGERTEWPTYKKEKKRNIKPEEIENPQDSANLI